MCLVLIIRICLLPLFFSQMRATQRMQVLQPQIQRIQRKYAARKDPRSKEAMQREIMALQQRHNANPLGSCLLSLIQAPILCSLFYTLQSLPASAAGNAEPLSGIDRVMAGDIESSSIFGVRIADSFGTVVSPQSHVVIGVAVALMCLMLFAMQWLLIHRNTPKDAMDSPQFRTQKLTAFVFPAIYVVSGGTLPFGVLLYWLTNNLWNFGQTLCQLRWFPAPGSEAGERKAERDHERENRRRAASGLPSLEEERAAAAREEAHVRREREKVGRQPQSQTAQERAARQALMAHGRGYGGCAETLVPGTVRSAILLALRCDA